MNCRWRVGSLFVVGLVAGLMTACAGTSAGVTPSVSLQVEAPDTSLGVHQVVPNETMHSGDRLAVKITADRQAHVYMVRSVKLHHEILADEVVRPGQPLRIPGGENWWEIGSDTGPENLILVASLQPLQPDAVLAKADGPSTKEKERCTPPKCKNDDGRGGQSLISRWDRKGTAVIHFPFTHQ